jgi:hypothetical protein
MSHPLDKALVNFQKYPDQTFTNHFQPSNIYDTISLPISRSTNAYQMRLTLQNKDDPIILNNFILGGVYNCDDFKKIKCVEIMLNGFLITKLNGKQIDALILFDPSKYLEYENNTYWFLWYKLFPCNNLSIPTYHQLYINIEMKEPLDHNLQFIYRLDRYVYSDNNLILPFNDIRYQSYEVEANVKRELLLYSLRNLATKIYIWVDDYKDELDDVKIKWRWCEYIARKEEFITNMYFYIFEFTEPLNLNNDREFYLSLSTKNKCQINIMADTTNFIINNKVNCTTLS